MPTLDISNFNKLCALGGIFTITFSLISLALKERLYLSESLVALGAGAFLSKSAGLGPVDPLAYTKWSPEALNNITRNFTRLVLGAQLVLAGVQLPGKYLLREKRSLAMLLGPVMILMWAVSSVIIWLFIPQITMIEALAIAACITPTDPILANSIVSGRFADEFIAPRLQNIIVAESGANDGLGYPFLFIALYFIEYKNQPSKALGLWCSDTLFYVIGLSIAYGILVGWLGIKLLRWAEEKRWVERESYPVFVIALAFFIVGTCGMVGSDDVLACFVAGSVFSIGDWYRHETRDDSLASTTDLLLNLSIFFYFGAVVPWGSFLTGSTYLSFPQLICISVSILVFRRLPAVLLTFKYIPAIRNWKQAALIGYFGPIGVSAVFYLTVLIDYTNQLGVHSEDGHLLVRLRETATLLVWFVMVSSVFVHGMTVPMITLGLKFKANTSTFRDYFPTKYRPVEDPEDMDTSKTSPLLASSGSSSYGSTFSNSSS